MQIARDARPLLAWSLVQPCIRISGFLSRLHLVEQCCKLIHGLAEDAAKYRVVILHFTAKPCQCAASEVDVGSGDATKLVEFVSNIIRKENIVSYGKVSRVSTLVQSIHVMRI
jgi:hypothetical protein